MTPKFFYRMADALKTVTQTYSSKVAPNPRLAVLLSLTGLTFSMAMPACDGGGAHRDPSPGIQGGPSVSLGNCVSHSDVTKSVFSTKCAGCHNWGDANLAKATATKILDKITNVPPKMGGEPMPKGSSLSEAEKKLVEAWVTGGAQLTCAVGKQPEGETGVPGGVPTPPPTPAPPLPEPTIAKTCAGCHGQNGVGVTEQFPNLAGQSTSYLDKQLRDFRSRDRVDPIMNGFAQQLSDADATLLSNYYASLAAFRNGAAGGPTAPAEASSCTGCHGANGVASRGMPNVPDLAGQRFDYLAKQLKAFKSGERKDPVMSGMVSNLTDKQIEDLAKYFSGL